MHSAAFFLGLLAGGVLSSPAPHGFGHKHSVRQNPPVVDVVDVVDVYTTVTLGTPQATPQAQEKIAAPPVKQVQQPPPQISQAPAPVSSAAAPPPAKSSPPPASSAAPAASSAAASSGNDYLDIHNKYRAAHGAQAMTWDSDLATKAQSEANGCPNDDVQSGSNWYGSSGASTDVAPALQAWYNEQSSYAQETNNYAQNPPSSGPDTGHFSQMIWNASTSLGCGLSSTCGGSWKTQVTCLYLPAGNLVFNGVPQYTKNVFPPTS